MKECKGLVGNILPGISAQNHTAWWDVHAVRPARLLLLARNVAEAADRLLID
jgi:hypothetical protein